MVFGAFVSVKVTRPKHQEPMDVRSATQNLAQTRKGKKTPGKDFRESAKTSAATKFYKNVRKISEFDKKSKLVVGICQIQK